jgi:hypothetical protein
MSPIVDGVCALPDRVAVAIDGPKRWAFDRPSQAPRSVFGEVALHAGAIGLRCDARIVRFFTTSDSVPDRIPTRNRKRTPALVRVRAP